MKYINGFARVLILAFVLGGEIIAQADDPDGLPIPIGAPVIYGQVAIEGLSRNEPKPTIFVSLLISGSQIDRRPTDGRGYFFFLQRPRHGHTLVFEVSGGEVGRIYLNVGTGNRLRQDVTLDWRSLKGADKTPPGVVAAAGFSRSRDAEKDFDNAMVALRADKVDLAKTTFVKITAADPNDYVAWTMLGTIHYAGKSYGEAASAFAKALDLKPDFTLARVNLGKMELAQKNVDKAIETLKKAVEIDGKSADANHFLGEAYLQAKKGSLAVGFLNKAIELSPIPKAEIHLRLAALYNGAGLKDRAVAEYKAFLVKFPDHPDRKKLEQYIKDSSPQ